MSLWLFCVVDAVDVVVDVIVIVIVIVLVVHVLVVVLRKKEMVVDVMHGIEV